MTKSEYIKALQEYRAGVESSALKTLLIARAIGEAKGRALAIGAGNEAAGIVSQPRVGATRIERLATIVVTDSESDVQ